jgi:ABC-2 type transport system ATP-binding protein
VLRAEDVQKAFHRGVWPRRRTVAVLKGASLMVCQGELVGLVGENGSGKSTLMQIIVGLLARDGGSVEQPGRLGYCPQTPMLWEKLTVDEHFELFARAYDLDEQARERVVEGLLAELQFERYRGYRIEEFSGGTRQKLNLALALMHEPDLLLLDEPYSGSAAAATGASPAHYSHCSSPSSRSRRSCSDPRSAAGAPASPRPARRPLPTRAQVTMSTTSESRRQCTPGEYGLPRITAASDGSSVSGNPESEGAQR